MWFEINYKTDVYNSKNNKPVFKSIIVKELVDLDDVDVSQLINDKTGKPYKRKCVLSKGNNSIVVEHAYEQIKELKTKNNRITVKGYIRYEND